MTPEFSRREQLDRIGEGERMVTIEADADERRRLAGRFGLVAVERLTARIALHRDAGGIVATGRVEAAVVQACSVTCEPLAASVDEPVALRFVDEDGGDGAEIELAADALDVLPLEGGEIDLGEAAATTMALALDPFPRGPAAAAALAEAGITGEDRAGAFGGLASLRDALRR